MSTLLDAVPRGIDTVGLSAPALGGLNPATANCTDCGGCGSCGVSALVTQTEIFVGDWCSDCHIVRVRLLDDCDPCGQVIDEVETEICACSCNGVLLPAVGLNEVVSIEEFEVVNGVAIVTVGLVANPNQFPDGIFGPNRFGLEVSVDGRANVCCAAFDCKTLRIGGPLNVDFSWFFGLPGAPGVKTSIKSSAKASAKLSVSSSGKLKASAKASSKVSFKASSKLGGWKFSIKAKAKASAKLSISKSGIKTSSKASSSVSIKTKGILPGPIPSPFILSVAGAFAGPGPAFNGAFAAAWANGLRAAGIGFAGIGGPGGFAGAGAGAFAFAGAGIVFADCPFIVLDIIGCDCACDCGCDTCGCDTCGCDTCGCDTCGDCPCTGPNCPCPCVGQPGCPCDVPSGPCGCEGRVTSLTLRYTGPGPAQVTASDAKGGGSFFSGPVNTGEVFTFSAPAGSTFGTNTFVAVNGGAPVQIHTSCSQPIGPGMVFGPFEVVAGLSAGGKKGGVGPMPLCVQPPGTTQKVK
jgi:hypothetical protein